MIGKKIRRNLAKSSPKNRRAKKCQNIYIKANFKVQNTYNKAIFKTQNTYNKAGFKTAYLGENRRICSTQKVAKKIAEQKNAKISTPKPILKSKTSTTKLFLKFKISTSKHVLKFLI